MCVSAGLLEIHLVLMADVDAWETRRTGLKLGASEADARVNTLRLGFSSNGDGKCHFIGPHLAGW